MPRIKTAREARSRRHLRLRQRVTGTEQRPRLSIYRSINHIYAQVVDDSRGVTLAAASTQDKDIRGDTDGRNKSDRSKLVGAAIAQRAIAGGVTTVVFDRGGYQYHGRVKAVAEAARENGLDF